MKRLCTICARGNSKGLPGKNQRLLLGKPLVAWSIEQAKSVGLFDMVALSSDSDAILEIGRAHGADLLVRRPADLASDHISKLPAIAHCLETAEAQAGHAFNIIVDLDATAPLRLPQDIRGAIELLESSPISNVITGASAHRSPYFNLVERQPDGSVGLSKQKDPPVTRRQDAPDCFDMNASIYVWRRDNFLASPAVFYADTQLFEMPVARSHDIDSELDFEIVEFLMTRLLSHESA